MALGTSLPARIPASSGADTRYISPSGSDTSGTGTIGSPWKTVSKAFQSIGLTGGLILCRGGTYSQSGDHTWNRDGNSGNPVQIKAYPGETPVFSGAHRWLMAGKYLRIGPGLVFSGGGASGSMIFVHWITPSVVAQNIEIVGNQFLNNGSGGNQSIAINGLGENIGPVQIWDNLFVGGGSAFLDHQVYLGDAINGVNVIANNEFRDLNGGFGIQLYPNASGAIVTCNTFDNITGGGAIVLGGDTSEETNNCRIVGGIFTNCSWGVRRIFEGSAGSGNNVQDCIGFNNSVESFDTGSGGTFTNCIEANPLYNNAGANDFTLDEDSPAYNHASARQTYVPVLDRNGVARTTADAGAYATGGVAPPPDPGTAPTNSVAPHVSGTDEVGQTLTVTNGTWQGSGSITFAREWQRDTVPIGGATGLTYVLVTADLGADIRVKVTASNAFGNAIAFSNTAGPVGGPSGGPPGPPVNVSQPTFSGVPQPGEVVTAQPGSWDGDEPMSFAYQWRRCDVNGANCADIGGETGSSYTQTAADVGSRLRIEVTATNAA